jgi:hypothetical protein
MASKLTKWINAQLKAKGKSSKEAQKDAGKYSSISAAKKAGSLYYTDKKGRVMIAAYAEDLAKPLPAPKKRPEVIKPKKRPEAAKTKKKKTETKKIDTVAKKPNSKTPDESSGGRSKVTTITIKEDDGARAGRSEKEKEIDNMTKKIAELRIRSADRKSTDKATLNRVRNEIKDQTALNKALGMDNTVEKERDARRSGNKNDIRTSIERETDLLKQELNKKYKRGRASPRAKGGLIDMRKKGLFK